ncbi:F-box/LRR-repeat protein 25-like [Senna tora]|uniref:F-box/LRR-repeat protein 25-like n=1 Tax=Senna tora TaxID=362788 RepID=A0A835CIR3_9FABA|nr:F-box/LRR-repeat protein 25-like [Senna tora]
MSKRSKICRGEMEDRISSLPDEVLHLILSHLNTKLAVQTCVLSQRWEYLWTGVSTLCLSNSSFPNAHSYSNFLDHVFSKRDHSKTVRQFKISFPRLDKRASKLALDFLVSHGRDIQDLLISFNHEWQWGHLRKPYWNLFRAWDSLKTLTLQSVSIPVNVEYKFASLISLHLLACMLEDDDRSYRIGGPCLVGNIKITAPQLKEFIMSDTSVQEDVDPDFDIILSFPKLISFCFEGEPMRISFPYRPVLQKLFVDFYTSLVYDLIGLFGEIDGAKPVTLTEETIWDLSNDPDVAKGKQPPFGGIEELKIIFERTKSEMVNNFSFTVPSCVLTYLQTMPQGAIFPMFSI